MKQKWMVLALSGALICTMQLPALAAKSDHLLISPKPGIEEPVTLPDSCLYYGAVKTVTRESDGTISRLALHSERAGDYVMNLSANTVWIDSAKHAKSDPATLKEGETIYVFHSPTATMSLPPQSAAFAIVRNVPQGAGCAQYHIVEAVEQDGKTLRIQTDKGGLFLLTDEKTGVSGYEGEASLSKLRAGDRIMAWYEAVAASYPGQAYTSHIMVLPQEKGDTPAEKPEEKPVEKPVEKFTRGDLVAMLYETAGKPAVSGKLTYADVAADAADAKAILWATEKGIVSGYSDSAFGSKDVVTREQLVTILWRYAGSPVLMDYPGLTQFSDADQISSFARQAMAWAHEKGCLSAVTENVLAPRQAAGRDLAEKVLAIVKR